MRVFESTVVDESDAVRANLVLLDATSAARDESDAVRARVSAVCVATSVASDESETAPASERVQPVTFVPRVDRPPAMKLAPPVAVLSCSETFVTLTVTPPPAESVAAVPALDDVIASRCADESPVMLSAVEIVCVVDAGSTSVVLVNPCPMVSVPIVFAPVMVRVGFEFEGENVRLPTVQPPPQVGDPEVAMTTARLP